MKIKYLITICWCFLSVITFAQSRYDVVVYGGTPGGFTAAIQVARMGKSVVLIEPSAHIGGIVVNGLGVTDIDSQQAFQNSVAVGGLALEFYRRIAKVYGREQAFEDAWKKHIKNHALWPHEPGVAEKVIKDWLAEYKIDVVINARLVESRQAVRKKGTTISQIRLENGRTISGKVFIDATYEGDLLAAAGISTAIGREANAQYGETLNGIRGETTHAQFQVKVNPYKNPEDPKSGLIATIQEGGIGMPGAADKHLQAYCFRACLTSNPANRIPFKKPANYDRNNYEIYIRYIKAGGHLLRPWVSVPNGKSDLGAWHDLSHNLYGMNVDYPGGNYATRKRVYDEHRTFTEGLFYFLANDPQVGQLDPDLQKEWAAWGLTKDEFTDNEGWPHMFYVRDARRMVSDYVLTEHHILKPNPTPVEDPVGVAFWPPDVHSVRRIVKDGYAYNEGFIFEPSGSWRPLPVSYRALVPKKTECTNLLTPTCPSSSHIAYGAIRLEWTFMVLGQSTATAAVLAIEGKKDVQQVDYTALKDILLKEGQVLELAD
ncbi:FAD-dependent oxidoreductase [Chitinophaga sp. MM2321]|uniref:FAD-dependent oxidoreductase n=1 Tax=Chitinophaga sp. MM2321 TaxID=3137178 RepID=UPI0032D56EF9